MRMWRGCRTRVDRNSLEGRQSCETCRRTRRAKCLLAFQAESGSIRARETRIAADRAENSTFILKQVPLSGGWGFEAIRVFDMGIREPCRTDRLDRLATDDWRRVFQ